MSEDCAPLPDNELSPWKLHLRRMETEKAQRLKNKKKRFHHKGPKKEPSREEEYDPWKKYAEAVLDTTTPLSVLFTPFTRENAFDVVRRTL